jgi:hypothetical protein
VPIEERAVVTGRLEGKRIAVTEIVSVPPGRIQAIAKA